MIENSSKMTQIERRASISLALVFALRMLGLFVLIPIFHLHAKTLPGGENSVLVGLAFGAYGLTQSFLHIPLGILSDRIGRKPVIIGGLMVFCAGCVLAAFANDVTQLLIARILQGMGAISAAITALLSDLTRESQRTKAMALVGSSIGLSFALGFMFSPMLYAHIGMHGIFIGMSALIAIAIVIIYQLPTSKPLEHMRTLNWRQTLWQVLQQRELLRFNFGVLILHATLMSLFSVIPSLIQNKLQLSHGQTSSIYLGVVFSALIVMMIPLRFGEKRKKSREVFIGSILLMTLTQALWSVLPFQSLTLVVLLLLYFISFNILEASQPSLVSKLAPTELRGSAMGVYNTSQSIGVFLGGILGGLCNRYGSSDSVFIINSALLLIWLLASISMPAFPGQRPQETSSTKAAKRLGKDI